jgi:endoglucanase
VEQSSRRFFETLLRTATPSGFETEGQKLWLERTAAFCDRTEVDVHGNAIAILNEEAPTRVILAGHCDEIGLMVTHIDDQGFVSFAAIGGVDATVLPGMKVVFLGRKRITGVIGKKPIHLIPKDQRDKALEIKDLWIDVGARDKKDAERRVNVGDCACIADNYQELFNGLVSSKALDDKAGTFVVSETLRLLSARRKKLNVAVFGVSTVQEEIGSRGAITSGYGIDPHAAIAIDVGFATDAPGDEKKVTGDIKLGRGPILHHGANINTVLGKMLQKGAGAAKVKVQWTAEPRATSTDAGVLQISRSGVATALVSIPTRYMHTPVEVCSLADIEDTAKLLARAILSMPANPRFIPF